MSTADQTDDVETSFEQLLKFSPEQRLEIAERLLSSVPPLLAIDRSEEEWKREIERRVREIEDGTVQTIPLDEAFRIVREDLKKGREERSS